MPRRRSFAVAIKSIYQTADRVIREQRSVEISQESLDCKSRVGISGLRGRGRLVHRGPIKIVAPFSSGRRGLAGALAWTSLAGACLAAGPPVIPDYRVGERAKVDVVTPVSYT